MGEEEPWRNISVGENGVKGGKRWETIEWDAPNYIKKQSENKLRGRRGTTGE